MDRIIFDRDLISHETKYLIENKGYNAEDVVLREIDTVMRAVPKDYKFPQMYGSWVYTVTAVPMNPQKELIMKEFNLEQALAGAPVITRDGTPVTELHLFQTCDGDYPLTCVIKGKRLGFTREGKVYCNGEKNEHDLFMAAIKKPLWVNRYPYGAYNYKRNSKDPIAFGYYFETKKAADDYDQTTEGRYNSAERLGGKAFLEEIEE